MNTELWLLLVGMTVVAFDISRQVVRRHLRIRAQKGKENQLYARQGVMRSLVGALCVLAFGLAVLWIQTDIFHQSVSTWYVYGYACTVVGVLWGAIVSFVRGHGEYRPSIS